MLRSQHHNLHIQVCVEINIHLSARRTSIFFPFIVVLVSALNLWGTLGTKTKMKQSLVIRTLILLAGMSTVVTPISTHRPISNHREHDRCEHTATSRQCWGDFSIDTDYYTTTPSTGITREYWLSVVKGACSPDGFLRNCTTFNGTVPGPAITADWGDTLVIHVTNNLDTNGTATHWHGIRMLHSTEYDGVPGLTQCPTPPGQTMTYRFRVTQYGTTWYHSHLSLQRTDGLYGPLILNGPATADYDEDLGVVILEEWAHVEVSSLWDNVRARGRPLSLDTGLVSGMNAYNCAKSRNPNCIGGGRKFEAIFESGKKYRIRLINVAVDGHFQFSIDGHSVTVIANDLVPIVPYETESVLIAAGQRYDLIVEADADPGDYWLRAG